MHLGSIWQVKIDRDQGDSATWMTDCCDIAKSDGLGDLVQLENDIIGPEYSLSTSEGE